MKTKYYCILFGLLSSLLLVDCQPQRPKTVSDFLRWMNSPEKGLIKEKKVDDIEYRVNFLPNRYLQLIHEIDELEEARTKIDSTGITFLLTISTSEEGVDDVAHNNVTSLPQLHQRIHNLNFELDGSFHLFLGDTIYPLGLYNLENVYNLRVAKQIYLAFDLTIEDIRRASAEKLRVRYIDEIFKTGIHYFVFDIEDLLAIT